jgi:hypothetical protein
MKPSLRPLFLLSIGWMVSTAPLWAHPGHDDGHELVWDFGHLAAHPLATLGCVAVLTGAAWLVWLAFQRRTKVQPASNV